MTAPKMSKPSWETEQRIRRNRLAKANRFIGRFFHQMRAAGVATPEIDKAALEQAIAIARAASQEQWAKLAVDMTAENRDRGIAKVEEAPSGETVALIVSELEARVRNIDYAARQNKEDQELFMELLRQRGTGGVGAEVLLAEEGSR
jgi:hypothetical protein